MKTIASVTNADGTFEMHLSFDILTRQVFYGDTHAPDAPLDGKCLENLHDDDDFDCRARAVAMRHWDWDGSENLGEMYAMTAGLIIGYRDNDQHSADIGTPGMPPGDRIDRAADALGSRYSKASKHVFIRTEIRGQVAWSCDHPVTVERAIDEVQKIIATWST